ncbi:DUF998 domain-containing protein [Dactylosporangium sp. CS-047395]|uniref:DUF998 domain-containing protein n=1 Tax=Dactylosporangium sp. CS-047395 TaxID=3239936 RepID=UPI003D8CC026
MSRYSLAAGAVAAPLFAVVALAQAATRAGYDLTRHPVSLLSNGDLGWVQITAFLLTGLLSIAAAPGTRAALRGGRGERWAPRLLVLIGAGMLVAAVFRLDPADGFPVGTPLGTPATFSWHAIVHNLGGSLSFFSMMALCLVLARRFAADGQRAWAWTGRACAVAFLVLLGWAFTGGRDGALTLFVGVLLAWGWLAATSGVLLRRTSGSRPGSARMSATGKATTLVA